MSRLRSYGAFSLLLLAAYAVAMRAASEAAAVSFDALEPWPLGGGPGVAGRPARALSLLLGLGLGWGVPGLCLALLTDARLVAAALLARGVGLGYGYVLATSLVHAGLVGHAPGRSAWLALLALPPLACFARRDPGDPIRDRLPLAAAALAVALLIPLWPKLAHEGLNGDGTEAYELARSLRSHATPHWDLEVAEGPGRFGTPAVNPFLTNSYLVAAEMALLGPGELAARLPLVPAVVLCVLLSGGLARGAGASGAAYLAALGALHLLWNAYYVGYEPAFTDLAEPAATDFLMVALWLAGFIEATQGVPALGVVFFLLASGVLYSAPLLSTVAILVLSGTRRGARRLLGLWMAALTVGAATALVYGASHGLLRDWLLRLYQEYWHDLAGTFRRNSSALALGWLLLLTGGLPLVAAARHRRLDPEKKALLVTAGVYLGIVLVHGYKNLHYLAPLPYLLAPAALAASGPVLRAGALAVMAAAFTLSWPSDRAVHRETVELGAVSCIDGLSDQEAALAGDVVYDAFSPPDEEAWRFGLGKHTFVRYAADLGGEDRCRFRLGATSREGWLDIARRGAVFSVEDLDLFAAWRLRHVPVPHSPLFPWPPRPVLSVDPRAWSGRQSLTEPPGSALVITGVPSRLLVPVAAPRVSIRVTVGEPLPQGALVVRVNGVEVGAPALRDEGLELWIDAGAPPWRSGWNLLEIHTGAGAARLPELRSMRVETP